MNLPTVHLTLLLLLILGDVPVAFAAAPAPPVRNAKDPGGGQPADDLDGLVTERLFRQYVVGRGKIPTASVNAAIELVAARGTNPEFRQLVLAEFEKSCEDEDASYIRRNLLRVMSKMLATEGAARWRYEHVRRTGRVEPSATTFTSQPSPENDKLVYGKSEMLERVIARGREANRHGIDAFVIAVRQAHHPQGKEFLLDVLRNPPDPLPAPPEAAAADRPLDSPDGSARQAGAAGVRGQWPDNVGGSWRDAKFHAAVGLAELGESAGVEWLIRQSEANDFGVGSMSTFVDHAPHAKATSSILRESCIETLADLSGLEATDEGDQWKQWWATTKDNFVPRPVALRVD